MNKAILTGNLGRDPEIRTTDNGKDVCTFPVATTEYYNKEKHTTWHNCVAWGATAKFIAEYFKKGSGIELEGKISNRSFDKDGTTKWISEVIVNQCGFTPGNAGKKVDQDDGATPQDTGQPTGQGQDDDDLPF